MPPKCRIFKKGNKKPKHQRYVFWRIRIPRAISVSNANSSQQEIDFLRDAEKKGRLSGIIWIDRGSGRNEDNVRWALEYLHSEHAKLYGRNIQKRYDYAWIKMAIDHGKLSERYWVLRDMSTPAFITYIRSLGFSDIADSKTLNKMIAVSQWNRDKDFIDFPRARVQILERRRRNRIAMTFLEILNEF